MNYYLLINKLLNNFKKVKFPNKILLTKVVDTKNPKETKENIILTKLWSIDFINDVYDS